MKNSYSNEDSEDSFLRDGLRFSCSSCGHCCRHEPGYVFLSMEDVERLTAYTKLSKKSFFSRYCRSIKLDSAVRLSLVETEGNDCVFWEHGCSVYEARPLQCRTYPFWPSILSSKANWEREGLECPGIGRGRTYSAQEIAEAMSGRRQEALIHLQSVEDS